MAERDGELWVFAYGSLMWRPDFEFCEVRRATLVGYHRAFCVYSIHYRGSIARPGIVLGLDRGGTCEGLAYRIAAEQAGAVLERLRRRELIYDVYREAHVPVTLCGVDKTVMWAVAFIAERAHQAYAGSLSAARQADLVRGASGRSGTNIDYLVNTIAHLEQLGIRERRLERLLARVGPLVRRAGASGAPALALTRAWSRRKADIPRLSGAGPGRFKYRRSFGS